MTHLAVDLHRVLLDLLLRLGVLGDLLRCRDADEGAGGGLGTHKPKALPKPRKAVGTQGKGGAGGGLGGASRCSKLSLAPPKRRSTPSHPIDMPPLFSAASHQECPGVLCAHPDGLDDSAVRAELDHRVVLGQRAEGGRAITAVFTETGRPHSRHVVEGRANNSPGLLDSEDLDGRALRRREPGGAKGQEAHPPRAHSARTL